MNENKKVFGGPAAIDPVPLTPKALLAHMSSLKMSREEMREFMDMLFERLLRPNAGLK
jgi:hypothetical protein